MLLVTIYRERAFDKQSSSKIMCDKTQSISNKCFSAVIIMWQRRDWCDVVELDQKTKLILHVISQSSIILLSQFCSLYAKRSFLWICVLYFITYQSLLHDYNAVVHVCKTQCLCVECSLDMEREWFYLIRQIFWACEIFFTLYQMNTQLITNWNHINSIYFMDSTKTHTAVPEHNSKLNIYLHIEYTLTM
jgi:nucleoid-associated protein YejK